MESLELSSGNFVRIRPGASPDATCLREARADRLGVLELEFLAWRFPPLDGVPLIVARDLGPVGNFAVLNTIARPAYLYIDTGLVDGPLLLGYTEGMELLWGGAAGAERQ